jgi:hypothetical protein
VNDRRAILASSRGLLDLGLTFALSPHYKRYWPEMLEFAQKYIRLHLGTGIAIYCILLGAEM